MTGELKKYEGTIRLILPGYAKETECKIRVSADSVSEANAKIEEEWKQIVILRDVRVKELGKVITAS